MNRTQVKRLRKLAGHIDALPGKSKVVVQKQQIYNRIPARDHLLAEIHRNVGKGVKDHFPTIESLGFETALRRLNTTNLAVTVAFRFKGKTTRKKVKINLADPAATGRSIAAGFA